MTNKLVISRSQVLPPPAALLPSLLSAPRLACAATIHSTDSVQAEVLRPSLPHRLRAITLRSALRSPPVLVQVLGWAVLPRQPPIARMLRTRHNRTLGSGSFRSPARRVATRRFQSRF